MAMKNIRIREMERYIYEHEYVTINELSEKFSIHINTVRTYINELASRGIVDKKYGGVSYKSYRLPTSYDERLKMNVNEKSDIGRMAATLLQEEDVIYIDAGTTTPMLFQAAQELPKRLTIITNSLAVINWCFDCSNYDFFVLPGKIDRELHGFASLETIESLQTYNIQKAFLGCRGIKNNGDLSTGSPIDAKLKETILRVSKCCILMASSDKVDHSSVLNFSNLREFDYWVCDRNDGAAKKLADTVGISFIAPEPDKTP